MTAPGVYGPGQGTSSPPRAAALEAVLADALVALPVLGDVLARLGCTAGARVCAEMLARARDVGLPPPPA